MVLLFNRYFLILKNDFKINVDGFYDTVYKGNYKTHTIYFLVKADDIIIIYPNIDITIPNGTSIKRIFIFNIWIKDAFGVSILSGKMDDPNNSIEWQDNGVNFVCNGKRYEIVF
jgi:hypothetical protein